MKVRKAVVPAAGFGTRFLPASRSVPKNMLPILDTPAIHFTVEEAAEAGIEHVVFVISQHQEAVSGYFGRFTDLELALKQRGDDELLDRMLAIPKMAEISYVHQHEQLGLGHAVLTAKSVVGNEPFAVFLPDDIIWAETPTIGKMIGMYNEYGDSVIAVKEAPDEMVPSLGVIEPRQIDERTYEVLSLVEKPSLSDAPSNLAIIGRYVLAPQVFEMLERTPTGAIGEIQLTDAIGMLLPTRKVYAYRFPGVHFDVGRPLGLLKASVYAALQREELASDFKEWIRGLI